MMQDNLRTYTNLRMINGFGLIQILPSGSVSANKSKLYGLISPIMYVMRETQIDSCNVWKVTFQNNWTASYPGH